jgi:hypothetical protein
MVFFDDYVPGMRIILVQGASDRADLWTWHYLYHCEYRWSEPWNGFLELVTRREWKRLAAAASQV